MELKAFITPAGAIILALVFVGYIAGFIYLRKVRNKLLDEGKIIPRESKFWDKSETFTVTGVNLEEIFNKLPKDDIKKLVGASELQNENNRIVFVHNGADESYTASLRLLSSENDTNTYKFLINQYKYKGGKPNEVSLNALYTAVEKTFLAINPDIKVITEYVDRKTKRDLF